MLPRVKIQFLNGQLGTVGESADGLLALIVGLEDPGEITEGKLYSIRRFSDVEDIGITEGGNPGAYKVMKDFYNEAEEGTEVIFYGYDGASDIDELVRPGIIIDEVVAPMNGKVRGILFCNFRNRQETDTFALPSNLYDALSLAQPLAQKATDEYKSPIFIGFEGMCFDDKKAAKDLSSENYNRVFVFIGDNQKDDDIKKLGSCMGTIAGRIATSAVQRNIGRVKDGSLYPNQMYIGKKTVEESESLIEDLYEKGYITPRKYVGRSGYFFTDDRMACKSTDDYAHLTARRVIDKAYRIAYDTLLDMMLDELEVNEDGTLQNAVVASWQQTVEDAINSSMTANGELSATDGEGCVCFIDPKQNVVSTSTIKVTIKVRPYGYARYVDVNLGFQVTSA